MINFKNKLILAIVTDNGLEYENYSTMTHLIYIIDTKKTRDDIYKEYTTFIINLAIENDINVNVNVNWYNNAVDQRKQNRLNKLIRNNNFIPWLEKNYKCQPLEIEKDFKQIHVHSNGWIFY